MTKRTSFLLLAFCISVFLLSFSHQQQQLQKPKASIKTLVIDPGHGGFDPGARGSFSNEADVSLSVAMKFGEALQKEFPDIKIVYTRTGDIAPGNKKTKSEDNRYRAILANESGGDLYIAIHCNSAAPIKHRELTGYKTKKVYVGKGSKRKLVSRKFAQYKYWTTPNPASGTETYIWAVNKNDDKINSINKNDDYGSDEYGEVDSTSTISLPDPSDPVEKARMLIYAQNYFNKSYTLADLVEKEFVATGRVSRGVKQRNDKGIWVLQATGMPSILVEIGFITNKDEEEYINSDKGQDEIVDDLINAFKTYKDKTESKAVNGTQ
jgi:N-acetylmuramoyl-L-alanine amidase